MLNDKNILFFPPLPWNRNCGRTFVKHYGSKFLISEQEALCLILEPYYDCFLVPEYGILVLWCHLAIDHLFHSVALWGEVFLPQSETFKCSNLISNFWARQIKKKKKRIKWYIFTILQNILTFSRELYWYEPITSIVIYIFNSINY